MSWATWQRYRSNLDWVEELLYLSALATEACMIYPWQRMISGALGYQPLPLWGLCILLWIPYLVSSLLAHSPLPRDRKQALVAGLILASALLAIRIYVYGPPNVPDPSLRYAFWEIGWIANTVDRILALADRFPLELISGLLVFIGWWRGIVASRRELDTQQVWYRFRTGVILMVVFFLVTIFGRRLDLAGLIFAYFFFGLLSIALSSILEQGGIQQSTMGSRQWILFLAATILGNLGLALLVSLLFSRQALQTVFSWLRPVGRLLQVVAWYLLSAMLYLLWPLLEWALAWFREVRPEGISFNLSPLMSPLASPEEIAEVGVGVQWMPACNTILVVLLVAGGLYLIIRTIRGLSEAQDQRQGVERESVWSGQDFRNDLVNSLQQGWNQLKALAGQLGGQHRRSAASIRKMYASMVDLATEAGYPRHAAETPYEYSDTLIQTFPGGQPAVEAITEAYVRVHYGEVPGSQAEMDRLVRHWETFQRLVAHGAGDAPPTE